MTTDRIEQLSIAIAETRKEIQEIQQELKAEKRMYWWIAIRPFWMLAVAIALAYLTVWLGTLDKNPFISLTMFLTGLGGVVSVAVFCFQLAINFDVYDGNLPVQKKRIAEKENFLKKRKQHLERCLNEFTTL